MGSIDRAAPGVAAFSAASPLARVNPPAEPLKLIPFLRALARNPMESWPRTLYEEKMLLAGTERRRALLVADPDLVQQVLVRDADAFGRTPDMTRALGPSLGQGLLTADGAHWRRQRRVAAPAFRHDRLASFIPAMSRAAEDTARRWAELPAGTEIDLGHEMMRTTFDIIVATMLSDQKALDVGRFERSIAIALETTNWAFLYSALALPNWVPYPGVVKATLARRWMRARAFELVAERRAARRAGATPGAGGRQSADLVDLLLDAEDPDAEAGSSQSGMGDREIADNILTFIGAGHETTALALTWAFYALSYHPETVERLLAEIDRVTGGGGVTQANLQDLTYTRQVVMEALRLYPSAPVIARDARRDISVGGQALRPGDTVVVPIYVVHRHARIWSDPDRFDPERFAPEAQSARHRYAYLPFGAGPRICIGMNFAINEAVAILATLLPGFRLDPAPGLAPELTLKITLRPKKHMRMRLTPRRAGAAGTQHGN